MTTITVESKDKEWFDDFKDGRTQKEAFSEMCDIVRAYNGDPVDVKELAEELEQSLLSNVELAAFRGTKEALVTYESEQ